MLENRFEYVLLPSKRHLEALEPQVLFPIWPSCIHPIAPASCAVLHTGFIDYIHTPLQKQSNLLECVFLDKSTLVLDETVSTLDILVLRNEPPVLLQSPISHTEN